MNFGDKLKFLRTQLEKTQSEVADEMTANNPDRPMSQARLSYLEGKDTAPSQIILNEFTHYYGVGESYFFNEFDVNAWNERKAKIQAYINSLDARGFFYSNSKHENQTPLDTLAMWQKSYNENPEY